jgi:competence protein ComEC
LRNPLLPPFFAFAGGVVAARFVSFNTPELGLAIAALAVLAAFAFWKSTRRIALAAALAACCFAGALVAVIHRPAPPPEIDAAASEVVILSGCVVNPPVFSADREQFTLELAPHARVRVGLYIKPGERLPDFDYGRMVELDARMRRAHNFRNPGSFDYAAYLARQDIYWSASGRAASLRFLPGRCGSRFSKVIFDLRSAALHRLDKLYPGDTYASAMTQAVLIGESSNLEKVWTEHFRRTGTYHTIVISGLHVTVLAGFLLFLLRVCFVPEPIALSATMLAAWLYALVAGWQAPAVRSAAGFALFVLLRYLYRRSRVLNILAAVALAFAVLDPEQLFDASFQLSFLAVGLIGALAVPIIERTSGPLALGLASLADRDRDLHMPPRAAHFRVELRLLSETLSFAMRRTVSPGAWLAVEGLAARIGIFCWDLTVISAVMQFGLALPMAVYFHRVSITGLSANLLIVPLMSAVIPVGFVAVFTGWRFAAALAGWLLRTSESIALWHVGWEPDWRVSDPPVWLAAALVIAVVTLTLVFTRRRAALFALGANAMLLVLLVWHPFPPRTEPGSLEVTAIDVGQGDGLFLAFPDGKLMMLDGGGLAAHGSSRQPRLDTGEDVVSPYLWSRSIRRLDAVALSHPHEDHIGGLAAIVDNFRPKELWIGAVADTPEWRHLEQTARRRHVRIVRLECGQRFRYGGAGIEVLAPLPDHDPSADAPNNDSLVLRVSYGRRSFLLTGDIERRVERQLADAGTLAHTDVLKVAHHGSKTSSTEPFLDQVQPAFAVISAGFENQFRFPNAEVLDRLDALHAAVLRTDQDGLVSIRSDGNRIRFETPLSPEDRAPGLYDPF